jgi:hypothetical protein
MLLVWDPGLALTAQGEWKPLPRLDYRHGACEGSRNGYIARKKTGASNLTAHPVHN